MSIKFNKENICNVRYDKKIKIIFQNNINSTFFSYDGYWPGIILPHCMNIQGLNGAVNIFKALGIIYDELNTSQYIDKSRLTNDILLSIFIGF